MSKGYCSERYMYIWNFVPLASELAFHVMQLSPLRNQASKLPVSKGNGKHDPSNIYTDIVLIRTPYKCIPFEYRI